MGVTVKELLIAVRTDMAGLKAGMNTMQKETNRGKTANDNLGLSVDGVAKKLKKLAIFVGAGVLFKAAITSTAEFGTSIANMSTLITDSNVNIGEMEQGFLDLAGPLGSAKELADAAYGAISAGVPAGEAVEFIGTAAMFAKANLIGLNSATDLLTTVMNTYGKEAGTAAEITDILTTSIRLGKTDGEALSGSLGSIAGMAKLVGIDFIDLNAAVVSMTAGGIETNQAMTALKAIISNIAKPTTAAKDAAKDMAGGFNLANLEAKGLGGFLEALTVAVGNDTQAQTELFGSVEGFAGIAVLAANGAERFTTAQVALKDSAEATKVALEKQQGTFASVMEGLKNQVEATFIKAILPALRDFAGWVTDNKDKIASAFEGMAGAIGTISEALLFAISTIPDFVTAMENAVRGQPVDPDLIYDNFKDAVQAFHTRIQTQFGLTADELQKIIDGIDFGTFSGVEDLSAAEDTLRKLLTVWDEAPDFENKFRGFKRSLEPGPYIALVRAAGPIPATFKNAGEKGLFFKERLDAIKGGKYGAVLAKDWALYEKGQLKTQAAIEAGTTAIEVQAPSIDKLRGKFDALNVALPKVTSPILDLKKANDTLRDSLGELIDPLAASEAEIEAVRQSVMVSIPVWQDFDLAVNNVKIEKITDQLSNLKDKPLENAEDIEELTSELMDLGAVEVDLKIGKIRDRLKDLEGEPRKNADEIGDLNTELKELQDSKADLKIALIDAELKELSEEVQGSTDLFSAFAGVLGDTTGAMDTFISVVGGIGDISAGFITGDPVAIATGFLNVIGSIAGIVGSTDWAGYATAEAKALGISAEMTDKLAALAVEMEGVNGALFVLMDEIIADENIQDLESFNFWLSEISRMMGAVGNGAVDASELDEALTALLENADDIGYLGRQFQYTVSQLDKMGVVLPEVEAALAEMLQRGVDGYKAMKSAIDDTDLIKEIDDLNKEMLKMDPASDEFLNAATKLDGLEAKLKSVKDAQEIFGNVSIGVFDKIIEKEELFATIDPLLTAIGGWENAMIEFANTSETILVKDFTDFSNLALGEFNKLIEAGVNEKDALKLLEPQLATLIGLSNDYGFAIDAETQALIDKGRQAGLNFVEEKSANDIIAEQVTKLVDIFERLLPDSLETFADAGETVFGKYQDWTDVLAGNLGDLAGAFPDDLPFNGGGGGGPGPGGGEPGFATGTGGFFIPTPKSFRVGETGPERVESSGGRMRVTPLGGGAGDGGGKTTQIFNFNISTIDGPSTASFMRDQVIPMLTAASRTGNFTIHSGAVVN